MCVFAIGRIVLGGVDRREDPWFCCARSEGITWWRSGVVALPGGGGSVAVVGGVAVLGVVRSVIIGGGEGAWRGIAFRICRGAVLFDVAWGVVVIGVLGRVVLRAVVGGSSILCGCLRRTVIAGVAGWRIPLAGVMCGVYCRRSRGDGADRGRSGRCVVAFAVFSRVGWVGVRAGRLCVLGWGVFGRCAVRPRGAGGVVGLAAVAVAAGALG